MSLKIGQLVYTRDVRTQPHGLKGASWLNYKAVGSHICLLLGHVQKGDVGPNNKEFRQLLIQTGLAPSEDLKEFLPPETYEKFVKFLQERYK